MSLLNLGVAEFVALLGATSALVVALYLLSRARKKQKVATLRFWTAAMKPEASHQRRRIQQPVSLLLQLLALALLMLALAQPRFGGPDGGARDHILVLDTSSWMAAGPAKRTLMDQAREAARQWLERMPATDRVMLVRADGLAVPATPMTSDRDVLATAIAQSRPSAAALNLAQAFTFAQEARRMNARPPGEIAFVGAGRIHEVDAPGAVENLRVIRVDQGLENCGLKGIGLRRSAARPGEWEVFLSVRNYGTRDMTVPVAVSFAGSPVAAKRIDLAAGKEAEFSFNLRTRAAGWLEARLLMRDALADDDRAIIEIPAQPQVTLAVFSDDPAPLRPLFDSNPFVHATVAPRAAYTATPKADIVLVDGFDPPAMPSCPILWLRPPAAIRDDAGSTSGIVTARWRADHEISAGLRAGSLRLESTAVLRRQPGDSIVAETSSGPVIVARTAPQRAVLFGYHPGRSESRYDVATPLLFANVLRWLKPEAFRVTEVHAGSVGVVSAPLDSDEEAESLSVRGEDGAILPYSVHNRVLRFFSGTPGTVRVSGPGGERVYSLTLPEMGDRQWNVPAGAFSGLPSPSAGSVVREIWPWLALAAIVVMAIEWLLYGSSRTMARKVAEIPLRAFARKAS